MIVPNGTLIMVVDSARLSVFRNAGEALAPDLRLVESDEHRSPQTAELGSDRPGRRFESAGVSRGAYDGPDYHQQEQDEFARGAAVRLNGFADAGHHHLILVAEPHVLGVMRPHLGKAVRHLLLATIANDYAGRPPGDVADLLVQYEG
jgi:protein required for attachment to host cells